MCTACWHMRRKSPTNLSPLTLLPLRRRSESVLKSSAAVDTAATVTAGPRCTLTGRAAGTTCEDGGRVDRTQRRTPADEVATTLAFMAPHQTALLIGGGAAKDNGSARPDVHVRVFVVWRARLKGGGWRVHTDGVARGQRFPLRKAQCFYPGFNPHPLTEGREPPCSNKLHNSGCQQFIMFEAYEPSQAACSYWNSVGVPLPPVRSPTVLATSFLRRKAGPHVGYHSQHNRISTPLSDAQ
eukprot:350388-Chlamydomonas_euryale.AAC.24